MTGRFIAIVGPSGVGKDSVMHAAQARCPDLFLVRRVITRPNTDGEDFEQVDQTEFLAGVARGDFVLHWQAHGLHYGIPATVLDRLRAGQDVLANLSRAVLGQLADQFENSMIVMINAAPDTLAQRLQARGREDEQDMQQRLSRATFQIDPTLKVHHLSNDGPLQDCVDDLLVLLQPDRV